MKQLQDNFATHGLVRPRQDRLFAGVCSGIGRRFGVMPEEPRQAVRQTVTVEPQPAYPGYPQR